MESILPNYDEWNSLATNVAYGLWAMGLLIILGYFLRLAFTGDSKNRYDFINRYEINVMWVASVIIILGACAFVNADVIELNARWIVARVLVTVAMGLILVIIIRNLLKYYYPLFIEK